MLYRSAAAPQELPLIKSMLQGGKSNYQIAQVTGVSPRAIERLRETNIPNVKEGK